MKHTIDLNIRFNPEFWVFGFEYGEGNTLSDTPKIWFFTSTKELCTFLWGRQMPHYAIFKNRVLVSLESSELKEIELQLNNLDTSGGF